MSTLGKILIVFQVVLSICFMAFAAAVSHTHQTWRAEAENARKDLAAVTADRDAVKGEYAKFQTDKVSELNAAKADMQKALADKVASEQERAELINEKKTLTNEKAAAEQQAVIAGEEATARLREAQQLREINEKLLVSRNVLFKTKLTNEDTIRSKDVDLKNAQAKNQLLLDEVLALRKQIQEASIAGNSADLDRSVGVPPKVEGEVKEVLLAKSEGLADLVSVSIGSDDGLVKGHTLIVYRLGDKKSPQSKYLGKIRIVDTKPDFAVGEVIKGTRTGVMKVGDKVTTKL